MDKVRNFELDRLYYGRVDENGISHDDIFCNIDGKYYGFNCRISTNALKNKTTLKDKIQELGLESLIRNSSFDYFESLTKRQIRRIYKALRARQSVSDSEVARIDEMSNLVACYISDLLGLNIASRPLTDLNLVTISNTTNILVTGLKEFRFRELLKPIVEAQLYESYDEDNSRIYTCRDGLIDSSIAACLRKARIKKDNIVSKNQFSLKVNAKEISLLDASSGYVVCYQGEEKVKRI